MAEIRPFTMFAPWARESAAAAWSRRQFLARALGASAVATRPRRLLAGGPVPGRKVIVVTFGGGARDDETFSELGRANIPRMVGELAPQGTFFPQVVNRGSLGHYVATASIAAGRYESFNNFVAQRPAAPTLFEYHRKGLRRPASDVWVIAPSNGFERLGASAHPGYGDAYAAEVVLPKRLLAQAAGGRALKDYASLLHDNYEVPATLSGTGDAGEGERVAGLLRLSLTEFREHARTLDSPDELSVFIAKRVMREAAPSLLFVTLHDMDIAHSGAFSLYLDAIRRADRLVAELWAEAEQNPEYKGRTSMLVLPDFGRDADGEASGFQHHRTGSAMARTTWMLALGRGAGGGRIVARALESVDLTPTVGRMLGFETPFAAGRPVVELL